MSLGRTSTALGAFYRRLAARIGKAKAITATARNLALLVYRVLSGQLVYQDPGASAYHQLNRARQLKALRGALNHWASTCSIAPPVRSSLILFLRRGSGRLYPLANRSRVCSGKSRTARRWRCS